MNAKQAKAKTEDMILSQIEEKIQSACNDGYFSAGICIPSEKESTFIHKVIADLQENGFTVNLTSGNHGRGCNIDIIWDV